MNGRQADEKLGPTTKLSAQQVVSAASLFLEKCVAFFVTTSIGLAFIALLWRRLRNTPFRPADIDAAFSIPQSISSVILLRRTPKLWLVTLVGLIAWIVPFATLQTPGSLTTMLVPWTRYTTYDVFVVNYEQAPLYIQGQDFHDNWMIMNWDSNLTELPTPRFQSEMPQLDTVARQVLAQQAFTPWESPCPGNCTFSMIVTAPSLSCNTSDLGWGNLLGQCTDPTCFLFSSFYNSTAALDMAMWTEETYKESDLWHLMWPNGSATCVLVNTTYPVEVTFLEKSNRPSVVLSSQRTQLKRLANVIDSYNPDIQHTLDGDFWANYHQLSLALAMASSLGTAYTDYPNSKDSSTWGAGGVMYQWNGIHLVANQSYVLAATFSHPSNSLNVPPIQLLEMTDVIAGIDELFFNLSLSLIGVPEFQTVVPTNCSVTTFVQAFSYRPIVLWRVYAPILGVGLIMAIVGAASIVGGAAAGRDFSDFAAALKVGGGWEGFPGSIQS